MLPLIPVQLTQVTTTDGVDLAGIVIQPKRHTRLAIIQVHGLNSSFTRGHEITRCLGAYCLRQGIGLFKFNNRGHDILAKAGTRLAGGGAEKFTDCLKDVDAVIALARQCGYSQFILSGHSTGANKALYYTYKGRTKLAGLMLTGPMSDISGAYQTEGKTKIKRLVAQAERIARRNPQQLISNDGNIRTAARTISLLKPGQAEDVFQYYRHGTWSALRSVCCPLLVVIGEHDQHLDRPVDNCLVAFGVQATRAQSVTLRSIPGADHGFRGKEKLVVHVTEDWLRTIL